ncbi:MAG: PD-(D/E)XK nuclease family protein [Sulfurimonas sp.]|nr:PD-(D/E)XK nuclease family protein [Sulfurimonas sp.]
MKRAINYYETGEGIIPEGMIKLSPSRFETFFSKPHEWFRELIMNEEGFQGNSGSNIGNIIHATAERYDNKLDLLEPEIESFIQSLKEVTNEDEPWKNLNHLVIREAYPDMQRLVKEYIDKYPAEFTEGYLWKQISKNVIIAGSYDRLRVNPMTGNYIIVDYKTTGDKLPPKRMEYKHKLQLYMYAWMLRKQGKLVDGIEVVYITRYHHGSEPKVSAKTGKLGSRGRDYPATLTSLQYEFTDKNDIFIDQLIHLASDTLEYFIENPSTAYMLFKDYRLKGKDFTAEIGDSIGLNYTDF